MIAALVPVSHLEHVRSLHQERDDVGFIFLLLIPLAIALIGAGAAVVATAVVGALASIGIAWLSVAAFTTALTTLGTAAATAGLAWLDKQISFDFGGVDPKLIAAAANDVAAGNSDHLLLDATGSYPTNPSDAAARLVKQMGKPDQLANEISAAVDKLKFDGQEGESLEKLRKNVTKWLEQEYAKTNPGLVKNHNDLVSARITGHLVQVRFEASNHNQKNPNPTQHLTQSPAEIAQAEKIAAGEKIAAAYVAKYDAAEAKRQADGLAAYNAAKAAWEAQQAAAAENAKTTAVVRQIVANQAAVKANKTKAIVATGGGAAALGLAAFAAVRFLR